MPKFFPDIDVMKAYEALSVEDLKREIDKSSPQIKHKEEDFLEEFSTKNVENERAYVHLRGLNAHYKHKSGWSFFIGALMFVMVAFQCTLLGLVGSGIWSFEKYTWLLPILLVQNFAQIIGLAIFIVKALFKEMDSN